MNDVLHRWRQDADSSHLEMTASPMDLCRRAVVRYEEARFGSVPFDEDEAVEWVTRLQQLSDDGSVHRN